jgi:ornithine--oxo-acid transaminase
MRDNARMVPSVRDILATRGGEEMALNDAHLNPQLGRIVRTLGFDKSWVRGEGAYLIDAAGDRYLDLLCGYGVFAVGRNHPDVIAALRDTMEAQTPNLPQLGVTLLQGVLAEQLIARAPDSIDALVAANSGAEAIEGAIKLSRAATATSTCCAATASSRWAATTRTSSPRSRTCWPPARRTCRSWA